MKGKMNRRFIDERMKRKGERRSQKEKPRVNEAGKRRRRRKIKAAGWLDSVVSVDDGRTCASLGWIGPLMICCCRAHPSEMMGYPAMIGLYIRSDYDERRSNRTACVGEQVYNSTTLWCGAFSSLCTMLYSLSIDGFLRLQFPYLAELVYFHQLIPSIPSLLFYFLFIPRL